MFSDDLTARVGRWSTPVLAISAVVHGNPLVDLEALDSVEMVMREGRVVPAPLRPAHREGATGGMR